MANYRSEIPDYSVTGPRYIQDPRYVQLMQEQAAQTERAGQRRAQQLREMIDKPVSNFLDRYGEAQDRTTRRLAEEQAAEVRKLQQKQLEQQIASEEEFGRAEREARLGSYKTQQEQAQIARDLSRMQMEEAAAEREMLGKIAPSGRTYAEERIMAPIEAQREQIALTKRQADLAEKQAAVNAETQRLSQVAQRLNISEAERANRVRDLTANIAAETDPQARAAKIDQLYKTASSAEIGEAITNIRNSEVQAQMMARLAANADPVQQAIVQDSMKMRTQAQMQNEALARLDSAIQDLEKAPPKSGEAESAAQRVAQVLDQFGMSNEAQSMGSAWEWETGNLLKGESPVESRTELAKKARARILNSFANNLEAQYAHIPGARETANQYRQKSLGLAGALSTQNLFQSQQVGAYPNVPQLYDPLNRGQMAQQAAGEPQFTRDATGQIKLVPQGAQPLQTGMTPPPPGGQPNPLFDLLRSKGTPIQQQAGK